MDIKLFYTSPCEEIMLSYNFNKKTLFLFPLNLAGNISNIKDILISYKKIISADIILSMWQCSNKADLVRKKYYNNCGLINLKLERTDVAYNFVSNNFTSKSYTSGFLNELIVNNDFAIHKKYSFEGLQCWHFSLN
ncbi:hypothetical protein HAV_00491 [Candidatus Hepatincola sp. Av]